MRSIESLSGLDQLRPLAFGGALAGCQGGTERTNSELRKVAIGYKEAGQRFATKRKEWYSASNGPTNLRELAKHVGKLWDYEVLYRKWSTVVHAVDLTRFLTRAQSGGAAFYPLRTPKELTSVAFLTTGIVLQSTRAIVRHYEIDCDPREWYISEVRERWLGLQKMQVDFVSREVDAD